MFYASIPLYMVSKEAIPRHYHDYYGLPHWNVLHSEYHFYINVHLHTFYKHCLTRVDDPLKRKEKAFRTIGFFVKMESHIQFKTMLFMSY
jgi:hypothetical protein